MNLEALRDEIAVEQKKGLPFILASVVIWVLITVVTALRLPVMTKNLMVFCCSVPLLPAAWAAGKCVGVDIFSKKNPLWKLGVLFTLNQMLYLLIVMWVFRAVPERMVMVHAMVFGAHLLPYSWLYRSKAYVIFSIAIPLAALGLGLYFDGFTVACAMAAAETVFVLLLLLELKRTDRKRPEPEDGAV